MTSTQPDIRTAARLLGGDVFSRRSISCPGPGHSNKDRSLEVTFNNDGSFVVRSYAGDDWRACRDHVKAVLGLSDDRAAVAPAPVHFVDPERLARQKTAAEIWARSAPITGTLAETYLRSRGLAYGGDALRFHVGRRMMVALITDAITGEPMGIHRTMLDRDGNRTEKKMLGAAAGGVVRLSPDAEVATGLAIAEGIETALAAPFRPIWACLSSGQVKAFPVLGGVDALTIFADHDRAGIDAANACGERWHAAGREVTLAMPSQAGADVADLREAA